MHLKIIGLLLCTLATAGVAKAQEQPAAPDLHAQSVEVPGLRNPEMKSYRHVMAGLDAFDEYHRLAPAVPVLRFRLYARGEVESGDQPAPALRIVGQDVSIPVPVSSNGAFSLPRNDAAYEQDADVILNRRSGKVRAEPEVLTPGLPENVRRLGDLRLECEVAIAIAKTEIPFLARAAINTVLLTSRWCAIAKVNYDFHIPPGMGTLEGGRLVSGTRSADLKINAGHYTVPLGDTSWPDDTLVELHFAPLQSAANEH
jgi:hypothetical protein